MRPPICAICDKHFFNEGGLVQFALTEKDEETIKIMEEKGYIGHPPGLEWFCGEHYEKAKSLSNLTLAEAMKILKENA